MKVIRIAESLLTEADEWSGISFNYNLEHTGYKLHPFSLMDPIGSDGNVTQIDELHEAAGRGCYESWDRPNPETRTNSAYLGKSILKQQHFSVLEHGCVTYWIDGVSRNLLLELERHRHFSYSVVSSRYVDMSGRPLVMPKAFAELPEDVRHELSTSFIQAYQQTVLSYEEAYRILIDHGFKKKEAREAARDILPGGISTTLFLTGNIRAYREMIGKRNQEGAAKDIQEFARLILADLKKIAPHSVQDLEL